MLSQTYKHLSRLNRILIAFFFLKRDRGATEESFQRQNELFLYGLFTNVSLWCQVVHFCSRAEDFWHLNAPPLTEMMAR